MNMLNHMGTKTIETQKLILRRFKMEDAQDMYNNWASDNEVTKYLTWPTHTSIEISKLVLAGWIEQYNDVQKYEWAIQLKETGSVIGSIGLLNIDNQNENCEIGYCISRQHWGKGITTEAAKAVLKFGIKEVGFERITGRHDCENTASGRVMQKCGLKYEGVLRRINKNSKGELVDCTYYSILKDELDIILNN